MKLKKLLLLFSLVSSLSFANTSKFQFSLFPGAQFGVSKQDSVDGLSLNLLGAENQNVSGLDLSLIGYRKVNGNFNGVHLSLFFEVFKVKGNMKGVAFSLWNDIEGDVNGGSLGLVNTAGGNSTFQFGTLNVTKKEALIQFGIVNYANSVSGVQFGFVNATQNLEGLQIGIVNYAKNGLLPVLPFVNFKKTF